MHLSQRFQRPSMNHDIPQNLLALDLELESYLRFVKSIFNKPQIGGRLNVFGLSHFEGPMLRFYSKADSKVFNLEQMEVRLLKSRVELMCIMGRVLRNVL